MKFILKIAFRFYILLILIIFNGVLNAQTESINSLKEKLNKKIDTIQTSILSDIGSLYVSVGKYDSALSYYFTALNTAESIPDNNYSIRILSDIADLYALQKKKETALRFAFRSLKLAEDQKDPVKIFKAQGQIGLIYFNDGQYNESLNYGLKNLGLLTGISDKEVTLDAYMRMTYIYGRLIKYDSALLYGNKAIEIAKSMRENNFLAMCLNNLAGIYQAQQKHDDALKYFLEAFSLIEFNDSTSIKGWCLLNISSEYGSVGNFDQSLLYAEKALKYFKTTGDKEWQKELLLQIANTYAAKKNYKEALSYMFQYDHLKDSLNTSESQNKLLELQSRYENDQKEKQIELLKKTAKLNTTLRNVFIIGSFLLAIIILLIARQYRIKKNSEASINLKNIALSKSLEDLKATQSQLIQSEKMASLGELTAGIAHEIQNPLNFVNNFSEVTNELMTEMKTELANNKKEDALAIADDIKQNLEKIRHHGKRADAIVKGMLQHSRINSGHKEPTDINALADEYLRLAYHGLRAKDKSFNAIMKTDYDESIGNIHIIPQDIGRVVLNVINNAFYAVDEKKKQNLNGYVPTVSVSTKKLNGRVEIRVSDNGNGIPPKILDKIFQPFFTTKPTGQGTGLGLSLAYDIITKGHGGELKVETKEGEGSKFSIQLPV